jgi:quercetin dioxygenase-like cupin family protein
VGTGDKYDPAMLQGYPAGSFVLIPAGIPHFVAAKESAVIVQLSGTEKFRTDYIEK